jgi:hypothetical protein
MGSKDKTFSTVFAGFLIYVQREVQALEPCEAYEMVVIPTVLDNFTSPFQYLVLQRNTRFTHEVQFEVGDATKIRGRLGPFFALVVDSDTPAATSKTHNNMKSRVLVKYKWRR